MRKIFLTAAAIAMTGAGLLAFAASPTEAAVFSVGTGFFGGGACADVAGANIAPNTNVQAYDCLADPNQQFEFYGETIRALGGQRCLDVRGAGTAIGTTLDSYTCNGTAAQNFYFDNGQIVYIKAGLCVDAGAMANGTVLFINRCNGTVSQNWQIK